MTEDDVLAFAAASMGSLWSLELLLFLRREEGRARTPDELIRELRSSQTVVADVLRGLQAHGLIAEDAPGRWRYQPMSPQLAQVVDELATIYAVKPAAVIRAIVTSPDRKLRLLSDAFKITE